MPERSHFFKSSFHQFSISKLPPVYQGHWLNQKAFIPIFNRCFYERSPLWTLAAIPILSGSMRWSLSSFVPHPHHIKYFDKLQVVEIPTRIHLVLQLAPGGELFTKLTEQGTFFFSGSVCKCALFAILHQESGYDRKRYDLKYSKANIQRRGRDKYSSKWLLP